MAVARKLVVRGVARAAHQDGLAIVRDMESGHVAEWSAFGESGNGPLQARTRLTCRR